MSPCITPICPVHPGIYRNQSYPVGITPPGTETLCGHAELRRFCDRVCTLYHFWLGWFERKILDYDIVPHLLHRSHKIWHLGITIAFRCCPCSMQVCLLTSIKGFVYWFWWTILNIIWRESWQFWSLMLF